MTLGVFKGILGTGGIGTPLGTGGTPTGLVFEVTVGVGLGVVVGFTV